MGVRIQSGAGAPGGREAAASLEGAALFFNLPYSEVAPFYKCKKSARDATGKIRLASPDKTHFTTHIRKRLQNHSRHPSDGLFSHQL